LQIGYSRRIPDPAPWLGRPLDRRPVPLLPARQPRAYAESVPNAVRSRGWRGRPVPPASSSAAGGHSPMAWHDAPSSKLLSCMVYFLARLPFPLGWHVRGIVSGFSPIRIMAYAGNAQESRTARPAVGRKPWALVASAGYCRQRGRCLRASAVLFGELRATRRELQRPGGPPRLFEDPAPPSLARVEQHPVGP